MHKTIIRNLMIGRTNSMTVMPQSMLRSFCALKEKRTAKHTNEWGKSDVQDWKNEVWGRLEEADKSESLSDLILERIKELVDNSTEKVPDFIYSSAIQLLLSKNLTAEAFTVLIQAHLNESVLDIGTYEYMMRCCKDDKLDHSFIIQTFNMLTEYFTPNNRMYDYYNTRFRILKSIKIDYNSDKNATLYSLLESHSKNKFPEIEPPARKEISSKNFKSSFEEEDSAHNTAEHKYSTYSQSRNTFILPNMAGKTNEVQGYQEIYNGLEAMFDTNKVMVVMPSSFDIKDKDGNLLFTVENNDLYEDGDEDEEYFSTEDIEDDEEELDIPVINKNPLNNNGNGSNNKPKK